MTIPCSTLTQFQSTFSKKLSDTNFNYFKMLVLDLLHKWEVGNLKAVPTHLIHMLYAIGNGAVSKFDSQ
jgi:hypothetical protein